MLEEYKKIQQLFKLADETQRPDVLDALADETNDLLIRITVATNPYTSIETLSKLMDSNDPVIRERVAANENATPGILSQLALDKDTVMIKEGTKEDIEAATICVKKTVAENRNTDTHTLDMLSTSNREDVKVRVARNKNTNQRTLEKLSKDGSEEIRCAVATNPNATEETIKNLALDDSQAVKMNVAYAYCHNEKISNILRQQNNGQLNRIMEEARIESVNVLDQSLNDIRMENKQNEVISADYKLEEQVLIEYRQKTSLVKQNKEGEKQEPKLSQKQKMHQTMR